MAVNRFVLNTISYHGKGAIKEIPGEITRRGYKKAFVCSDPDLVKFGVTAKVTDELDAAGHPLDRSTLRSSPTPPSRTSRTASRLYKASGADMHRRHRRRLLHGHLPRASASSSTNPEFADVTQPRGRRPHQEARHVHHRRARPRPAPPLRSPSTTSSPTRTRTASSSALTPTTSPRSPSSIPT